MAGFGHDAVSSAAWPAYSPASASCPNVMPHQGLTNLGSCPFTDAVAPGRMSPALTSPSQVPAVGMTVPRGQAASLGNTPPGSVVSGLRGTIT